MGIGLNLLPKNPIFNTSKTFNEELTYHNNLSKLTIKHRKHNSCIK